MNKKNEGIIPEIGQISQGNIIDQGIALQQLKTTHMTSIAKQEPRDLGLLKLKVLNEANLSGDNFFYQWDKVLGISIEGAMILARNWQNCVVEVNRVDTMIDHTIYYASFVDYENNFVLTRSHKINHKFTIYGKHDEYRKEIMRYEIGQSKAIRNVILAAMPEWLKDQALDKAMEGVKKRIEDEIKRGSITSVIDRLLKALKGYGVTKEAILDKFNFKTEKDLSVTELTIMFADLKTLKKGSDFPEALYPGLKEIERDDLKKSIKEKADDLKKSEKKKSHKKKNEKKSESESESEKTKEDNDIQSKNVFFEDWENAYPADRLTYYVENKGNFNLENFCKENKIIKKDGDKNPTKNFTELRVNDQVKVLWILNQVKLMKST